VTVTLRQFVTDLLPQEEDDTVFADSIKPSQLAALSDDDLLRLARRTALGTRPPYDRLVEHENDRPVDRRA
jgi:hypothetical protein